ncbi:MAG: nucleotidyltransferase domain-containing protein [Candidatus Dojkabacteria bacterium]|nr:MAG: nucleotidyltransferase domain-containing protein [Candidatus Dojkabacteria bacterium]
MKLSDKSNKSMDADRVEAVIKMIAFRKQMEKRLDSSIAKRYWGNDIVELLENLGGKELVNKWIADSDAIFESRRAEQLRYAERIIKEKWYLRYGVLFVGVSGSLAAGTYKEEDDIDLFVVTKDYTAWIYRGLVKLFGKGIVRYFNEDENSGKLCINFVCEERGTTFDEDIFTLHELLHLQPVYNKEYHLKLLSSNPWVATKFQVSMPASLESARTRSSNFIKIANSAARKLQILYMRRTSHAPDTTRINESYRRGRIEFYPSQFHEMVMKQYEQAYSEIKGEFKKHT